MSKTYNQITASCNTCMSDMDCNNCDKVIEELCDEVDKLKSEIEGIREMCHHHEYGEDVYGGPTT